MPLSRRVLAILHASAVMTLAILAYWSLALLPIVLGALFEAVALAWPLRVAFMLPVVIGISMLLYRFLMALPPPRMPRRELPLARVV